MDDDSATAPAAQLSMATSRRAALGAVARLGLGSAAMVAALQAGEAEEAIAAGRSAALPSVGYHFVFVNHATTDPFFTPVKAGAADACTLLGCTYSWTGSASQDPREMVRAIEAAIADRADGIAVAIVDEGSFDAPTSAALAAGIPVVSYNADASPTNRRLAYIGQDLFRSGVRMGQLIARLVGTGLVGLFTGLPGLGSLQPRLDGARSVLSRVKGITLPPEVGSGTGLGGQRAAVESWWLSNQHATGMFAADLGTAEGIIQTVQKHGLRATGVKCGGYDLSPLIAQAISGGLCDFTIDQQPYLQGFYPVVQLYLYKLSGGLLVPESMDTGSKVVTAATVAPYLKPNVYQGSSTTAYGL